MVYQPNFKSSHANITLAAAALQLCTCRLYMPYMHIYNACAANSGHLACCTLDMLTLHGYGTCSHINPHTLYMCIMGWAWYRTQNKWLPWDLCCVALWLSLSCLPSHSICIYTCTCMYVYTIVGTEQLHLYKGMVSGIVHIHESWHNTEINGKII